VIHDHGTWPATKQHVSTKELTEIPVNGLRRYLCGRCLEEFVLPTCSDCKQAVPQAKPREPNPCAFRFMRFGLMQQRAPDPLLAMIAKYRDEKPRKSRAKHEGQDYVISLEAQNLEDA